MITFIKHTRPINILLTVSNENNIEVVEINEN